MPLSESCFVSIPSKDFPDTERLTNVDVLFGLPIVVHDIKWRPSKESYNGYLREGRSVLCILKGHELNEDRLFSVGTSAKLVCGDLDIFDINNMLPVTCMIVKGTRGFYELIVLEEGN